ncbi:lipid A-modifier LpxR family protein [Ekhidna sp. To15]|uniref:lipid A-modifier LpxR family protein n=1 Tax=Ekhidna sp. To15 TaxID=3395267 RepID=UPI003F525C50
MYLDASISGDRDTFKFVLLFLILFVSGMAMGQSHRKLNRELQIENDNDAYTLNLSRDQYYSNGVAIRYRMLIDSSDLNSTINKKIRSYDLNHRIYSPKHLFWDNVEDMDRPYAGQVSLAASNEYYYKNRSYLKAKLELGWMGPSLRTGDLQYEWHKTFGMQLPLGWEYEINNAPIINIYGTYASTLLTGEILDLISESSGALGTSFTHVRQELTVRFGTFKPIQHSTHYNGVLGIENKGPGNHEFYFFLSPGYEYVAYNATIEGNFLGEESIYTETRVPGVFQMRAGIMASWTKFDFALLYYRRTKETTESTFHKYIGIRLNQRF